MRAILILVAVVAIAGGILVNFVPGGAEVFNTLTLVPSKLYQGQIWRLFTAGFLSNPKGLGFLFTLVGLYFLSPDLEKRWGAGRFLRFLLISVLAGWVFALAADRIPLPQAMLHPAVLFGSNAAITAVAVAWSRENASLKVRLFFFLPVSGRQLFWVTIGFCILNVIFGEGSSEGVIAPFGGVLVGVLFSGSPSLARRAWLNVKLFFIRRQKTSLSAEQMLHDEEPPLRKRRPGAPPLRVLVGGLDDELKKRKPPKDKRYLN